MGMCLKIALPLKILLYICLQPHVRWGEIFSIYLCHSSVLKSVFISTVINLNEHFFQMKVLNKDETFFAQYSFP
jgi:hypothetical protein